ncbi:MAG: N-methyl-L-tryptophan oxidase [Phycisphaerales bacterium]|nr:N-methyl-L-tryptophan oxidase [Phycisphaerales bacterium]
MTRHDVAVIGLGGMGGAAAYHLARRGAKVLGLEQFDIGHDRGSSHGGTRIIRRAYFEHPDYLPLVDRSFAMWAELERAADVRLFTRTGLLFVGPNDGPVLSGVRRSRAAHALDIEDVDMSGFADRFPGFNAGEGMSALFERDAGYLTVETCVRAHVEQSRRMGATVLTGQTVQRWSADSGGVVVETESDRFTADRLIVCAGGWSARLLADLRLPLVVLRKAVQWHVPLDDRYDVERGAPIFGIEVDGAFFYGFPRLDERGVKIGEHTGGQRVDDPDRVNRGPLLEDETRLAGFVRAHLPGLTSQVTHRTVCLYTMTPDEHFIVDRHPKFDRVVFAAGFSGHGFKFAPVIGAALADLALDGRTNEPIGFLSLQRDSLRRT